MRRLAACGVVALVGVAFGGCSLGTSDPVRDDPPARSDQDTPKGEPISAPKPAPEPVPAQDPARASERARERARTFSGTLQGGMAGIGGESTGWQLDRGGDRPTLDVDVSKVRDQAAKLDGRRVTITGRVIEKKYVERGTVRVLIAERIEAAAAERY